MLLLHIFLSLQLFFFDHSMFPRSPWCCFSRGSWAAWATLLSIFLLTSFPESHWSSPLRYCFGASVFSYAFFYGSKVRWEDLEQGTFVSVWSCCWRMWSLVLYSLWLFPETARNLVGGVPISIGKYSLDAGDPLNSVWNPRTRIAT